MSDEQQWGSMADALRYLLVPRDTGPSPIAPPPMQDGEAVEDYLTRMARHVIEVRLVDATGRTRIVRVPYGTDRFVVAVSHPHRIGFFGEGDAPDVSASPYREVTFTTSPDVRLFDRENRPVWFPESVLRLPPSMWPRFRTETPVLSTADRAMHRELDQWERVDQFNRRSLEE